MKEIPLTRGLVAFVDDEDYGNISKYKWFSGKDGYAIRQVNYPGEPSQTVIMHRAILGLERGNPVNVDHIDGNRINNCRSNLRKCTRAENSKNRRAQINNKSGFKGVSWNSSSLRWRAQIGHNGKKIYLGQFEDPEEAYAAYCRAALELHGEFANLGKAAWPSQAGSMLHIGQNTSPWTMTMNGIGGAHGQSTTG